MSNVTNVTNETMVEVATDVATTVSGFIPLVLLRFWQLLSSPFKHPEMLWIIFPLLLTFLVLEFYFDRHGDEQLGWAAAVANSLILFIVAIDLIKHSFNMAPPYEVGKEIVMAVFTDYELPLEPQVLMLILFLAAAGVAVTLINYYHLLPKRLAFEVSGHPPVNFLAFFAIAIVYSAGTPDAIPLDIPTLIAGILLYVVLLVIVFMFKRSVRTFLHGKQGF